MKIRIPNPHKADIGRNLLFDILKQANIEKILGKIYKTSGTFSTDNFKPSTTGKGVLSER